MKHIPKHLIPALGLVCWGALILMIDGYDFTYYLVTAVITAFVTGLLYRKAANRALETQSVDKA